MATFKIMSEPTVLSQVAELLRPVSKDVSNGRGKLCLSTVYLKKLNDAFDENVPEDLTSSFHLTDAKASLQRDLQFLLDLVKGTVALKVTPDLIETEESSIVSFRRFKNIKILEIHKIDIRNVLGIQRLRSQIQELSCLYNIEALSDILAKCGGDLSSPNLWSELKWANFSHNRISDIDSSLESTPWLNTLDLSYNQLTGVEFIYHLPNLKNLNLSFNKLEKVPRFRGPICKRLQILLFNNNFIEDLSGLSSLTSLSQLDLSQNCITDHKSFLSISHISSLYFLNVQGNPISFHPHHRTITSNYLNKNTVTLKFVLDNLPLNKSEKLLAGSLYPVSKNSMESSPHSSLNSLENVNSERPKKVRNVEIQEGFDDNVLQKEKIIPNLTPRTSSQYLDVKNKIEHLHQEHGESWLTRRSGEEFKKVLGFDEDESLISSTPSEKNLVDLYFKGKVSSGAKSTTDSDDTLFITAEMEAVKQQTTEQDENGTSNCDQEVENISIYDRPIDQPAEEEIISSDDEDADIFFASSIPDCEDYDLSIIVTEAHLSERDVITCKLKARWQFNIVKSCQRGQQSNEVRIVFDTFRSDRKSRTYFMEEADQFIKMIFERMIKNKVPDKRIQYQCIKCNELFSRTKVSGVLVEQTVACPKCESTMVIESK